MINNQGYPGGGEGGRRVRFPTREYHLVKGNPRASCLRREKATIRALCRAVIKYYDKTRAIN